MAGKRLTKAQVIAESLRRTTELDKKSVARVFDSLQDIIRKQLTVAVPASSSFRVS